MSSADPPSRIPPRQQQHETKTGRDELSSKGKVEKVREIDPEEARKKNKFLKYYNGDEENSSSQAKEDHKPTPFELYSGKKALEEESLDFGRAPPPDLGGVDDAAVPSPPYAQSPHLSTPPQTGSQDSESQQGNLSDDFWEKTSLPDEPTSTQMKEAGIDSKKKGDHREKVKEIEEKEETALLADKKVKKTRKDHAHFEKKREQKTMDTGAPVQAPFPSQSSVRDSKKEASSPSYRSSSQKETLNVPLEKQGSFERDEQPKKKPLPKQDPSSASFQPPFQEKSENTPYQKEDKKNSTPQIESPSLPQLPPQVGAAAMTVTQQLAPYLNPSISPLFFQMVGTISLMSESKGLSQTEILLNNPAYAHSKFYGATIIIEKYATAPDSFNIRLQGPQQAVALFKENIPSLMNAFQKGNFSFRINRIDAEYTVDRPMFRRKEKGQGRSHTGDGDLGGSENHR